MSDEHTIANRVERPFKTIEAFEAAFPTLTEAEGGTFDDLDIPFTEANFTADELKAGGRDGS